MQKFSVERAQPPPQTPPSGAFGARPPVPLSWTEHQIRTEVGTESKPDFFDTRELRSNERCLSAFSWEGDGEVHGRKVSQRNERHIAVISERFANDHSAATYRDVGRKSNDVTRQLVVNYQARCGEIAWYVLSWRHLTQIGGVGHQLTTHAVAVYSTIKSLLSPTQAYSNLSCCKCIMGTQLKWPVKVAQRHR